MRISDWSSDVCSSDLLVEQAPADADGAILVEPRVTPKAGEEQLEALRFDDCRAGGVVDDEVCEIGLAGHRSAGGEFGSREQYELPASPRRTRHLYQAGCISRGREYGRVGKIGRRRVGAGR